MTTDNKIWDKKTAVQYNTNRETAKISAVASRENDKYKYLTDEKILPIDQSRMIEQAKFTYYSLGKVL